MTQYPPTLELDGACLRPLRADDRAAFFAYLRDPLVTERTSYPEVTPSLVEAIIERSRSRWATGELSKWGIACTHDDQLIGTCGFNDWTPAHRWAELAYDLSPAYWGRGLMRRAVTAVLDWGFGPGQVDRVQAYVRIDNERSIRLLEQCRFVREGCLRSFRHCRGQAYDFYVYGLLRLEWCRAEAPERSGPDEGGGVELSKRSGHA